VCLLTNYKIQKVESWIQCVEVFGFKIVVLAQNLLK
jgi:hypothetical protein